MDFYPAKTTGLASGLSALAGLLGLGALALAWAVRQPPSLGLFAVGCGLLALIPLSVWLIDGVRGLLTARYRLNPDALVVVWGGRREVIPLTQIEEAHPATEFPEELRPPRIRWPGCTVGVQPQPALGAVEFLAAATDKARLVLIGYPGGWLALSPQDPAAFLAACAEQIKAVRTEGVQVLTTAQSAYPAVPQWALWRDRLALTLIALGGAALWGLAGYLCWVYPQLPPEIALRFDAQGLPMRLGSPIGLFTLLVIGASAWGLNTVLGIWLHGRTSERAGAYLLFGAAGLVQALVWVAALSLLTAGRGA